MATPEVNNKMQEVNPASFADHCEHFSNELFDIANLDIVALDNKWQPTIKTIERQFETHYKSNSRLKLQGIWPFLKPNLQQFLEVDEIAISFYFSHNNEYAFLVMTSRLARILITRLLATNWVDSGKWLLLSGTEKGILSFIVTQLMFETRNTIKNGIDSLRIGGVFHSKEPIAVSIKPSSLAVLKYELCFDSDKHSINLVAPIHLLKESRQIQVDKNTLFERCGHVKQSVVFNIKKFSIRWNLLTHLRVGDLIVFDESCVLFKDGGLQGNIVSAWRDFSLGGHIIEQDGGYQIVFDQEVSFTNCEDKIMEEVQISGLEGTSAPINEENSPNNLINSLASQMVVNISIELASIGLSLKEVCQIKNGTVIDLKRKISDPLSLVLDGKVIGQAIPVQIEDRLGIKITLINAYEN
jgi:flagellar motor switch/type III secretory pathway protein FliN